LFLLLWLRHTCRCTCATSNICQRPLSYACAPSSSKWIPPNRLVSKYLIFNMIDVY
jgi:hypothetical protein